MSKPKITIRFEPFPDWEQIFVDFVNTILNWEEETNNQKDEKK